MCEGQGNPLHFKLSPGQTHESTLFEELLDNTFVNDSNLQYYVQPIALAGDKAYRAAAIIESLEIQEIQPVIPEKANRATNDLNPEFDRELYRRRNVVERLIGSLKEARRIFSRFEKTAVNFSGMITMAFIHHYLRLFCP